MRFPEASESASDRAAGLASRLDIFFCHLDTLFTDIGVVTQRWTGRFGKGGEMKENILGGEGREGEK